MALLVKIFKQFSQRQSLYCFGIDSAEFKFMHQHAESVLAPQPNWAPQRSHTFALKFTLKFLNRARTFEVRFDK